MQTLHALKLYVTGMKHGHILQSLIHTSAPLLITACFQKDSLQLRVHLLQAKAKQANPKTSVLPFLSTEI